MRRHVIQLADIGSRPRPRARDRRPAGTNPGLLLQRFLACPAEENEFAANEKRALLGAAVRAARSEPLRAIYDQAFRRWNDSFQDGPPHRFADLYSGGRLIVGLGVPGAPGRENVLEAGIRLHHTYGLPVIPGSALKGLAAHYCDHGWGQRGQEGAADENQPFRRGGTYHDLFFGTTDDGGVIAFHDAWIVPEGLSHDGLTLDVMTPHHPQWQTDDAPPTDFDSPVPVAFLSASGMFRVRISWTGPSPCEEAEKWTDLAFRLLKEALAEWGVGGKTSSGYGRLVPRADESMPAASAASETPAVPAAPAVSEAPAVPDASRESQPAAKKPSYGQGQSVTVTRIADPKGKNRKWFAADDGFGGVVTGEQPAEIDLGQTLDVEVAAVLANGYNFRLPRPGQRQRGSGPRGRHPGR
jgi:CRISPR-associated protein Cmr6